MDRIIQKKISNKSAVRSLAKRKVKWIDQAETLLPRIAPALSAVTGNPVPALPLFSGSYSPEKTFEPLRRSEPSNRHVLFNSHTPFLTVTDEKCQTLVFFLVCFISCENLIRTILYFPECLRQGDERRFLSERH